jgi:hypothetical protein
MYLKKCKLFKWQQRVRRICKDYKVPVLAKIELLSALTKAWNDGMEEAYLEGFRDREKQNGND